MLFHINTLSTILHPYFTNNKLNQREVKWLSPQPDMWCIYKRRRPKCG